MSALICTVGTTVNAASDIVDAQIAEIRSTRPEFVVFIVSQESKSNAERIASGSGLSKDSYEFIGLSSPHDLNEVFELTNRAIRSLRRRGFDRTNITVNYTGGTKVMGSGAVLAAVFNQCEELRYIYEAGDKKNEPVTTHPRAVSAYRDLLLACRLIEELRFPSARDLLERIDSSLLSQHDLDSLGALRNIAHGYYYWENFRYREAVPILCSIPTKHEILRKFCVEPEVIAVLSGMADDLDREVYSPGLLADMMNNAVRRRREGMLDDAVTRVYRALEMLAQWMLHRSGIDTNDLDTRRVPPRYRVNYEAMRSMEDGQVRIGMRKAFELLEVLDAPIGSRFEQDAELQELLQRRGRSILAHGTHPMKEEDCDKLLASGMKLLREEIENFDVVCAQLQFPWVRS